MRCTQDQATFFRWLHLCLMVKTTKPIRMEVSMEGYDWLEAIEEDYDVAPLFNNSSIN